MTQIATGIGLRHVRIGLRNDTDGVMALPDDHVVGACYPGIQLSGATTLTLTPPEPETVPAPGDDAIYWQFQLPPTEGWTAELACTKLDLQAIAMITGVAIWGESEFMEGAPLGTDREGQEENLVLWGQRQGVDTDPVSETYGATVWEVWEILCCRITPMPPSKERSTVGESRYRITLQKVNKRIVGEEFTEAEYYCTKATLFQHIAKTGKVFYDFDVGDAAETEFVLTHTPTGAEDIYVFQAGVNEPAGWTLDVETKTVTFVGAPDDGDALAFLYTTDDVL